MRPATEAELGLLDHARRAAERAYAPYSGFAVGAALRVRGEEEPVVAVNVENASFGLSMCAERNAVAAAVSRGLRDLEAVAVHGPARTVPPCGACRQVLSEFAPRLTVVFLRDGVAVAAPLDELLPERFAL